MAIVIGPVRTKNGASAFVDTLPIEFHVTSTQNSVASNPTDLNIGVPSLFNPYAVVAFPSLAEKYNRLIDGATPNNFSAPLRNSIPTISRLVEDQDLAIKTPYNYTDFLYCKYVDLIPNNQLITLRRYPAPTFDNLEIPQMTHESINSSASTAGNSTSSTPSTSEQKHFFPIAQAVTWFGEETGNRLSDILSFGTVVNWKLVEAEVNTVTGNEQGSDDSPLPGVAKFIGILTGQVNTPFATKNSQYDPYASGPYSQRVYGPVNVISKTYKRDRGLDFKQSITLHFHYSLKSIGNINPKAAMLDLMSNMLALTYNNAAFWGGANRYFPQRPTYPFLGGKDGMYAWYTGRPSDFAKSVGKSIADSRNNIADILGKFAADPIQTLKGIAAGAAKLGMIAMGRGKAPDILAIKALLTGEPIGEWHMVIGNPFDPISKVGNLICTESKFQFNDIIGADNFPTELTVSITVEHARPRDAGDIQSMFNQGNGRIYYPAKAGLDVLNKSASTVNSTNDTSWKKGGNGFGNYSKFTGTVGLFTSSAANYDAILGSVKNISSNVGGGTQDSASFAFKLADMMAGFKSAASVTNAMSNPQAGSQ